MLKLNQVLLPIRSPPTVALLSKLTSDAAVVLPSPYSEHGIAVPSATETPSPATTMTSSLTHQHIRPPVSAYTDIKLHHSLSTPETTLFRALRYPAHNVTPTRPDSQVGEIHVS